MWGYPAMGVTHMFLLTAATALLTEQSGLLAGGYALAATAAAPVVAVPLVALDHHPDRHRRSWLGHLSLAVAARLAALFGVVTGWPLPVVLALLFTGSVGHRIAASNYKATMSRLYDGADGIAALTVRNAAGYATASAVAGLAVAHLPPAGLLAAAVVSCGFAGWSARTVWHEGGRASHMEPATFTWKQLRPIVGPAVAALVLWTLVSGYARLHVPLTTDLLGPAAIGWAVAAYLGGTMLTRRLMTAAGNKPVSFWAVLAIGQLLPWMVVDFNPWLLLAGLLLAGPLLHAAQAAIEHRVGAAVDGPLRPLAFTIGNGMLVLGGVAGAPVTSWLVEHTSFTITSTILLVTAVLLASVRWMWQQRQPPPVLSGHSSTTHDRATPTGHPADNNTA